MKKRIILTLVLAFVLGISHFAFVNLAGPTMSSEFAVQQLEDDNGAWQEMQAFEKLKSVVDTSVLIVLVLGVIGIWGPFLKGQQMKKSVAMLLVCVVSITLGGCRKPYDEAEYKSVKGSQTAIVIPLEGSTSAQGTLKSAEYLKKHMVAEKRIRIPHRWHQTGRRSWNGKWISTVRVILVDRAPVPREWTADTASGTSDKNQAIWVESKDSVGFSIGFNCTAYIEEGDDTATFLYRYPSSNIDGSTRLATIMDTEIRAMIQAEASMACALYNMDDLRAKKIEVITAIRNSVIPFFKARGITITTIGMFGGFTYENEKIQSAIDDTFVAQQDKVIAAAMFDAQQKKNDTIELEAEAIANKERTIAAGKADRIREIAKAAAEAESNPVFLELRKLEVEKSRIDKWDGAYPQWYMGSGGDTPGLIIDAPAVGSPK